MEKVMESHGVLKSSKSTNPVIYRCMYTNSQYSVIMESIASNVLPMQIASYMYLG